SRRWWAGDDLSGVGFTRTSWSGPTATSELQAFYDREHFTTVGITKGRGRARGKVAMHSARRSTRADFDRDDIISEADLGAAVEQLAPVRGHDQAHGRTRSLELARPAGFDLPPDYQAETSMNIDWVGRGLPAGKMASGAAGSTLPATSPRLGSGNRPRTY